MISTILANGQFFMRAVKQIPKFKIPKKKLLYFNG